MNDYVHVMIILSMYLYAHDKGTWLSSSQARAIHPSALFVDRCIIVMYVMRNMN